MEILSSAKLAQLARIGSVVRSVGPAFLGSGRPPDNLDGSNLGSLRDARCAAFGARAVRKEGLLTLPVTEGFAKATAAAFGCWPMMARARPKMGLAGQRDVSTGKSSRPAGQMTSGITLENRPNLDLGVLGEVVSMLICLMARLMQQ
jgi:hypothetical protein